MGFSQTGSEHTYFSMTALNLCLKNCESCVHVVTEDGQPIEVVPLPFISIKPACLNGKLEVNINCSICKKEMPKTSKEIHDSFMSFDDDTCKKSVSSTKNMEDKYSKI